MKRRSGKVVDAQSIVLCEGGSVISFVRFFFPEPLHNANSSFAAERVDFQRKRECVQSAHIGRRRGADFVWQEENLHHSIGQGLLVFALVDKAQRHCCGDQSVARGEQNWSEKQNVKESGKL